MSRPSRRAQGAFNYIRATEFDFEWFRHLPYMDISSSGESPFMVAVHTYETSATYCVSMRTERVLLFRARDANSRIVNNYYNFTTRGPRIHDGARQGDSESERLRKRKAVTPHRPAKRPRLFQADQQETELRQRRTFCNGGTTWPFTTRRTCMVVASTVQSLLRR